MKKDDYSWWTKRIKAMSKLYDIVRVDHFRGFDSYYAIPAKDTTARRGEWRKGPGMDLFRTLEKKLGRLNIIVEDLGFLTPSVLELVEKSGFPGMKVIQFAFDSREGSNYLPHTYHNHCVVYTGTHDNDTLLGWMKTAPKESVKFAKEILEILPGKNAIIGVCAQARWASVGDMAIVPMQDLIGLGSEARMNTPSTLGGNWQWRQHPNRLITRRQSAYTNIWRCTADSAQMKSQRNKPEGQCGMLYFIVNEKSRSGKGAEIWQEVKTSLSEKQINYQAGLRSTQDMPFPLLRRLQTATRRISLWWLWAAMVRQTRLSMAWNIWKRYVLA